MAAFKNFQMYQVQQLHENRPKMVILGYDRYDHKWSDRRSRWMAMKTLYNISKVSRNNNPVDVATSRSQNGLFWLAMIASVRINSAALSTMIGRGTQSSIRSAFYRYFSTVNNVTIKPAFASVSSPATLRKMRFDALATNIDSERTPVKSGLILTREIDYIFRARNLSRVLIKDFVANSLIDCSSAALAHLMRVSGKQTKHRRDKLLRFYLPAIALRIKMLSTKRWSFHDIANVVYGLQRMEEKDDGVLDILSLITAIADETATGDQVPLPQNISMLLQGLDKIQGREKESKELLKVVVKMINSTDSVFEPHHISSSLFGLQSMSGDRREVRDIISALTEKVKESTGVYNSQNIGQALYGLQGVSTSHPEVLTLLTALEVKIRESEEAFTPKNIHHSLHGLQLMSSNHVEVRNILRVLAPRFKKCETNLTCHEVAAAVVGLQGMSSNHMEVIDIIKAVTPLFMEVIATPVVTKGIKAVVTQEKKDLESDPQSAAPRVLDALDVKYVLSGLRRMNSDSEDVRALLKALGPHLLASTQALNSYQLEYAFGGIRELSSSRSEVRAVLKILTRKVLMCRQVLSSQCVGAILSSLVRMSSDSKEVRELLSALPPLVKRSKKPFTLKILVDGLNSLQACSSDHAEVSDLITIYITKIAQLECSFDVNSVGRILEGMQEMNSACSEVRDLLRALLPKMKDCDVFKSGDSVSYAMFGLQGMSSEHKEVMDLLTVLTGKITGYTGPMSADNIGHALYGLQSLREAPETLLLVDWLHVKLEDMMQRTNQFDDVSTESLQFLCRILVLLIPNMRISLGEKYDQWESISNIAVEKLNERKNSNDEYFKIVKFSTKAEMRVVGIAKKVLPLIDSAAVVSVKEDLCGLFTSDILLTIPRGENAENGDVGREEFRLNIEVDGLIPSFEKKKKYRVMRDDYLRQHGYQVERIDILDLMKIKDASLSSWITGRVNNPELKLPLGGDGCLRKLEEESVTQDAPDSS